MNSSRPKVVREVVRGPYLEALIRGGVIINKDLSPMEIEEPDWSRAINCFEFWQALPQHVRAREVESPNEFFKLYIYREKYRCPITGATISIEAALSFLCLFSHPLYCRFFKDTLLEFDRKPSGELGVPSFCGKACVEIPDSFLGQMASSPFGRFLISLMYARPLTRDLEELLATSKSRVAINLFEDLIIYLRDQVRFDDLRDLIEVYIQWFNKCSLDIGARSYIRFFDTLTVGVKNLNARVVNDFPVLDISRVENQHHYIVLCRSYFRLALGMAKYDVAKEILESAGEIDPVTSLSLALLTHQKPFKVERQPEVRQQLQLLSAELMRKIVASNVKLGPVVSHIAYHAVTASVDDLRDAIVTLRDSDIPEFVQPDTGYSALFATILSQLIRLGLYREGAELLSLCSRMMTPSHQSLYNIRLHFETGSCDWNKLRGVCSESVVREYLMKSAGLTAWRANKFFEAFLYFSAGYKENDKLEKKVARQSTLDRLQFLQRTSDFVNSVVQPRRPKGLVLLATLNCFNSLAMLAPVMVEIKRRNFAVAALLEGVLDSPYLEAGSEMFLCNHLFNSIRRERTDGNVVLEWNVDWGARVVSSEGVNFYQGIYEHLSAKFRRSTISLENPLVKESFDQLIMLCDYLLRVCLEIEKAARSAEYPIVIVGSNTHIAPYSVFRDFILERSIPNLRFVSSNVAYENYYTNLGSKFSGSMAVVDMTLHRTCRAPFLALRHRFEEWYEVEKNSAELNSRFLELIHENRNSGSDEDIPDCHDLIVSAKNAGKRVVCCFGKVLCDLAVPYDGGPAHSDMKDWLQHSVSTVAGSDVLLLIKPHPHELRPEIALDLTEKLEDFLPEDLPENVILLGHRDYNVHELARYIDLAVLWNGTSCLELTGLGVPVIMCSHFGKYDYPVDLIYPENRDSYEESNSLFSVGCSFGRIAKKGNGFASLHGDGRGCHP
ncbi:hypothetical protein [Microbulbifer elongatus]|uniref:hypothetical protein n=1 Tax=Microbulbifer elongatus TaxID=86173 RepID=UPI001E5E3F3D|nr:hypothetical protein [Microbulbifer elongatus]